MEVGRVDIEDVAGIEAEVESFDELHPLIVGHDHVAVGGTDVGCQGVALSGRIDADNGDAGQGGAIEPEQVLRPIGKENADMERAALVQR